MKRIILSLCDHSGNWLRPYAEDSAYEVLRCDLRDGNDARLLPHIGAQVHGILMAPPCTHFAVAGASSWRNKGDKELLEGLQVVDACLRAVAVYRPKWWALENPAGRLSLWLGPWAWTFQPHEYGGWLGREKSLGCPLFPPRDAYSKRTCVWGNARKPRPKPVPYGRKPSGRSGNRFNNDCFDRHRGHRSITPLGFAYAFKEANP